MLKKVKTETHRVSKKKELPAIPETDRMQSTDRYFFDAEKQQKHESVKKSLLTTGVINLATNQNFRK